MQFSSSPLLLQATLLQKSQMGGWLDRYCMRYCLHQIWSNLCIHGYRHPGDRDSFHCGEFILSTSLLITDLFDDQPSLSSSENIFDNLPALFAPPESDLHDELDCYLSMDPEHITNALAWWHEKRFVYPHLHHMALDYLTIPGEFYLLFDSLIFILTSDFFTSNICGCWVHF